MISKWTGVIVALLLFFVAESSLFPWIIPAEWRTDIQLYPKLMLVGIIYVGILTNRHAGAVLGVAFGLLQDVLFYGHMLGVNAFTFALAAYAAGLLLRSVPHNLFSIFMAQISALLLYELSLYGLYRLFSVTDLDFSWAFLNGMLPSLLVGLLFALILYIPARKWLETPKRARDSEEN